ncbi:PREDICTED: histidine kinase CKI1 [Populus euphratica]|uniref:histidine kinase n=1 Tax=Populus euphratica TaxID=75702 RepID=A0AAJ6V3Y7_POPEU|nr:PREDICTED: histidine kinase CKI1 [Populus euphratica]
MKLSSLIASRPVLIFIILAIGVLLLPCVVVPWWYNMIKQMKKQMDFNAHVVQSGLLSEIENIAKLLHPINSSAINLARVISSSINGSTLSSYDVENKVAPLLFQAFSIIPFISQISYIGLGGLFFSYYYEGNQTFAIYSNSTASNVRNFSWYRQPVDSDTGRLYGDAVKSFPFIKTNASWIEQALNSSQGYASFESGWNSTQDPLFLNTASLNGQGVLSLGFSAKALTSFFNDVELYGGSLYLATQSGKVLVGGLPNAQTVIKKNSVSLYMTKLNGDQIHHVGNVSCMPNNGKLEDSVVYLGEAKYRVSCSQIEIVGVQSVYALAFPYNGLTSSVNRSTKISLILFIIMIAAIFVSIVSFILLVVRSAKREMHLCSALIKQMEATQQAERKSMNKSLAFASASHDIRAALAGITGLIEICYAEVRAGSELDTNLRQMDSCTNDLVGLLNSILDTSKIEAGKMQLQEEEFDLAKLLEDAVDLYHPVGMKKGVDVVLDPYDGSILKHSRVKGDRGKLKQVLCNLLSNAVKFTFEGHVSVRAWTQKPSLENKIIASNQNGLWRCFSCFFSKNKKEFNAMKPKQSSMEFVFEVNDTGKGIPREKQKSVFENFVQVKETALGQGGTGLGLGIVQSLVRLMGGEIGIVNKENDEKGTCFKFNVFLDICEIPSTYNKNAKVEIEGDLIPDDEQNYSQLTIRTSSPGLVIRTPSPRLSILSSSPKTEGSHVVLLIQNGERLRSSQKYIEGLGIKVSSVKEWEHLHSTLKRIKARQNVSPHSSSGKSDLGSRSDHFNSRSLKDVPLSSMDGIDQKPSASRSSNLRGAPGFVLLVIDAGAGPFQELCRVVAEFKRDLHSSCCKVVWLDKPTSRSINLRGFEQDLIDPRDDILLKPFHGSRLYQVIRLLPEFGGHELISRSKRGSTIQATNALKDPGSSSSTHSQKTKLKIPLTCENSFQQVDSQAEGSLKKEKNRKNFLLEDPDHSHVRSKSRQSPTKKLPVRSSSEIQEARGNLSKGKSLRGLKFLIADDNEISRRVTRHILKGHGATVEVCENGDEAFQLVRMGLHNQREYNHSIVLPYDYILMDCEMPKMDGCEATRQIRKEEKFYAVHIPILTFSADNSGGEGKKMEEAGTDGRVNKKINMEQLEETMRNIQQKKMHL